MSLNTWSIFLVVRLSSYGCTREAGRALEKKEKHLASPRATQTLLSCSPNFPRASITRQTHAKHGPFDNALVFGLTRKVELMPYDANESNIDNEIVRNPPD